MAFADILAGSPGVQTAEVSGALPAWYQQALINLISKAGAVADQPPAIYPGQAIAGFVPEQQRAFELTSQQVGQYAPLTQQAQQMIGTAAEYDPAKLQQFLSPYVGGVVEEIGRLGQRGLTEQALPQAMAAFTGAGQFGSQRAQEFAGRTIRDTMADIAGKQAAALQAAYDAAQGRYNEWAQRGLAGAGALSGLAQAQQAMGLRDIAALGAAGEAQQQLGQRNLDWAYQQFQQQQQYPQQQIANLSAILHGLQVPEAKAITQTATGPTPSGFSQMLGGLGQYAGIFGR